tara:strand:- start:20374 stop:21243 length:870 start_codon:yes stop_codon:yes gene_type:complete
MEQLQSVLNTRFIKGDKMINNLKERKKYRILEKDEIEYFLKMTSKKSFNYKDWIKTEEDWWDLANFCMDFHEWDTPSAKMRRSLLNINQKENKNKRIADLFFPTRSSMPIGMWDRGPRQSFTYKYNRISEHISNFCSYELYPPNSQSPWLIKRQEFDIGSIFIGHSRGGESIDSGIVGVVEANDTEDAEMQLKMFVYPMIGFLPGATPMDAIHVQWCGYISNNQKMDAFVLHNGQMIAQRKDHLLRHEEKIKRIRKKIDVNKLVIEAARGNLLANIQSSSSIEEIGEEP